MFVHFLLVLGTTGREVVGKFVVRLCDEAQRDKVQKRINGESIGEITHHVRHLRELPALLVRSVSRPQQLDMEGVCSVEPVHRHKLDDSALLDKEAPAGAWWHTDRINQDRLPLDGDDSRVSSGFGTNLILMDTGLDATHPQFSGGVRVAANVASYVPDDAFDSWTDGPANNDYGGHGTKVASTAAGNTLGVAPEANVYMLKVLNNSGWGDTDWTLQAFDKVAEVLKSGILAAPTVVSASFGDSCLSGRVDYCRHEDPQARAIASLVHEGVAVVVSAGNQADDGCFYMPQAAAQAFSVAASDVDDALAYFSNYGACVDVVAPGVDMPVARSALLPEVEDVESGISIASGTSFAAPAVAGALLQYADLAGVSTADARHVLLGRATRHVLARWHRSPCASNDRLLRVLAPSDLFAANHSLHSFLKTSSTYEDPACILPSDRDAPPVFHFVRMQESTNTSLRGLVLGLPLVGMLCLLAIATCHRHKH